MRFKNPASPRTCTHCRVLFFAAVVLAWVPPWISGSPASPRTCSHCRMGFPRCRSPRLGSLWIWESSLAAHLHSLPCAFPRCRCPRLGPPLDFGESSLAAHTRSLPHGFSSLPLSSPGFLLDLGRPASPYTCTHCRMVFPRGLCPCCVPSWKQTLN